jgi:hypothetical protein
MRLIRCSCKSLFSFIAVFLLISHTSFSQSASQKADSLYQAKNFELAARYYLQAAEEHEFKARKKGMYYNAACCFALAGKKDSAISLLKTSFSNGSVNIANITADTDLSSLHNLPEWKVLLGSLKPATSSTTDPNKVELVTTDVDNFWKAYDLAKKDTASRLSIYKQYYVDAGSVGLQDYFALKVRDMKSFIATHDKLSKFYASIRKNTYTIEKQKPQMMANFRKFKELYPAAVFSNVYFVIGAFTSGGTVSEAGMLIGLDQSAATPDIPTEELSLWQRNNFTPVANMPYLIAHELIHFNQDELASDTTLLRAVLIEGMADFIGQLISGKTANERLHAWAKGKEKDIWSDFRKEMYLNRSRNWIANSDQETADKPADLGYWVGYQICKAYYENSADKKQAVHDILNIKNYKEFYEKSGAAKMYP